jgi:hypothetical protein
MPMKLPFLNVDRTRIVDEVGRAVTLKGVALGGWLMMEGYMSAGRNIPEKTFREEFAKSLGREALEDFTRSYRDTFIQESDIRLIKEWGANCVRVPFNYRLIEFEERPFSLNEEGLTYLDRIVEWCEKYSIYCILDMHAAPGCQNNDWHSDSTGKQELFANDFNRDRYLRLWHFIAGRYASSSAVAGYDILNEPVIDIAHEGTLKDLYEAATREIRDADKRHIIFLEGNIWAQRLKFLGRPRDANTTYSIHTYPPTPFVFNLEKDLQYPGKVYKIIWNRPRLEMLGRPYRRLMERYSVPLYVGEFGVNWRGGSCGEARWVRDMLGLFKKHDLSWTYWTYKTVAHSIYPDGIFRYVRNPPWVRREGPVYGWENLYSLWTKEKGRIIFSWRTENFKRNDKLYSLIGRYF